MEPAAGQDDEFRFPNYDWAHRQKLGQGAYGLVYKVLDKKSGQFHAIKQFNMKLFEENSLIGLETEIEIMKELQHDHLARMLDYSIGKHFTYVILELCDSDLRKQLQQHGGKLPQQQAIKVLGQVMRGFRYMVDKGYLHRDIKPENTLIKDQVYKVADFGFSCKADIKCINKINVICGSTLYMAPQLLNGQLYTAKSDIWSIGIMFYETLFGYQPWPSRSVEMYTEAINKQPLAFPYNSRLGQNTKDFIKKCLVVREQDRIGWDKVFEHPLIKESAAGSLVENVKVDQKVVQILRKIQQTASRKGTGLVKAFTTNQKDLNLQSFGKLLREIDPNVPTVEINMLFHEMDKSKDGLVSLQQVKQLLTELDFRDVDDIASRYITEIAHIIKQKQINLPHFFRECDKDHNGNIGFIQFKELICKLLPRMSANDIKVVFDRFDRDNSGDISLQEFTAKVTEGLSGQLDSAKQPGNLQQNNNNAPAQNDKKQQAEPVNPELVKRSLNSLKLAIKYYGMTLKELVGEYDTNSDQKLDFNQFNKLVQEVDKRLPENEVRMMFNHLDKDHDGKVDATEMRAIFSA